MKKLTEPQQTVLLCKELEQLGAMVLPIVGGSMQPPGWPDRYVHMPCGQWWLEFKGPQTKLGVAQRERIRQLNRRELCSAFVVRFRTTGEVLMGQVEDEDGLVYFEWYCVSELVDKLTHTTARQRRLYNDDDK